MTADSGHSAEQPGLPGALAETLRYGPFHRALHDAIAHRGLSLARLRAHLESLGVQVGQSTLSYWQRGLRHPEVPRAIGTVRALETVLRLPAESLVALVGQRPQPRPPRPAFAEMAGTWVRTRPLLGEFDSANADLEVLLVHDSVLVGTQGEQRSITTRLVVRALHGGPDRYVAVHQGDEGCVIDNAIVRAGEGCRQGRVRRQSSSRGLAFELLFDRRLAEGEEHVFSFTVLDDTGGPTPGHHRTFRRACRGYLLQLAFNRRALPARCTKQIRDSAQSPALEVDELICGLGGVASAYFGEIGPGMAGISVEWT
ncbi:hypothetical protein GCM10022243_07780 [Saccharothrix violaceirubra]|uniref:Uncharacterized protein n=1 Tax=Saccharothrix violaceirubra TaxID=413306 RepID=A0A7W7SYS5_9PSEU|nr:hypothetical protein [Saccharothrix violaceirubra]MBB4963191.1 hypothetical protein [Saccharothrix violaceirubra]